MNSRLYFLRFLNFLRLYYEGFKLSRPFLYRFLSIIWRWLLFDLPRVRGILDNLINLFLVSSLLNSGLFLFVHKIKSILCFGKLFSEKLWLTSLELHYLYTHQFIKIYTLWGSICLIFALILLLTS